MIWLNSAALSDAAELYRSAAARRLLRCDMIPSVELTNLQQNARDDMAKQGVWIKDARTTRFSDYPLALSNKWDSLWWMIGTQSGPLNSIWACQSEENEALVESAVAFTLPDSFFNYVWRPNVMRIFAPHLNVGEWSCFCGVTAPNEEDAKRRARNMSNRFPLGLGQCHENGADIVIFDVDDGLLFIWSVHPEWQEAFTSRSRDWDAVGDWRELCRSRGWY